MKKKIRILVLKSFWIILFIGLLPNFLSAQEVSSIDTTAQVSSEQQELKKEKKIKKKKDAFKIVAGVTVSSLNTSSEVDKSNPQTGFLLGFSYKRGRFFYYEIGARYNQSSYQYKDLLANEEDTELDAVFDVGAIEIPINIGLNITSYIDRLIGLRIFAGAVPSFGIAVGDNSLGISKDDINSFIFNAQAGLGVDVAFLFIETGFNYGFSDLLKNNIQSNPQQFFVNLGFRF